MRTTAEAAKAIRTEARAAINAGTIKLPDGAKLSVRSDSFSCGASIDITVRGLPDGWGTYEDNGLRKVTPAAKALGNQLAAILRKHQEYEWGSVAAEGGLILASVPRPGWAPGQD